jgi:hypothetical protein
MSMLVFWIVMLWDNVSEEHTASIFKAEMRLFGRGRGWFTRLDRNWPTRVEERGDGVGQYRGPNRESERMAGPGPLPTLPPTLRTPQLPPGFLVTQEPRPYLGPAHAPPNSSGGMMFPRLG